MDGCGAEAGPPDPPAKIPAGVANGPGSSLGFSGRSGDSVYDWFTKCFDATDLKDAKALRFLPAHQVICAAGHAWRRARTNGSFMIASPTRSPPT